jgi:hypothetical protein
MIEKLLVLVDNKLVSNKFTITKVNNKIVIKSVEYINGIIKVPVYNKINGIDYYPIVFPLEMPIYGKNIFNPYIILSTYSLNFPNEIDFFSQINSLIESKLGLTFLTFDNLLNDTNLFTKIINDNYGSLVNFDILKLQTDFNDFIQTLWLCININKMFSIYILSKHPTITNKNIKDIANKFNFNKKLFVIPNQIKTTRYDITLSPDDFVMNFPEYCSFNFKSSLKLSDIKPNTNYYILVNKTESGSTITTEIVPSNENTISKVIKIHVNKVNKNIIGVGSGSNDHTGLNTKNGYSSKNVLFENYKWFYYHPNIQIDNQYILYQTFINKTFAKDIIKNGLDIDEQHVFKILEYYHKENKASNLMALNVVFDNFKDYLTDINILKLNSFSDGFFDYITQKYSNSGDSRFFDILAILFENYNYPLKNNRHEFDAIFDYILYFSLYNYKSIWVSTNNKINSETKFSNIELLHPNINSSIPIKLKNLYVNLMKVMSQVINEEFEAITFNQKFYSDYLHKNIIKILLSDSPNLSVVLFKNLLKPYTYEKFKSIVQTNMLLIDISNKLSWNSLPKKLNYLNIFYKNDNIVHYQDKLNKNIIPDNFDFRIKKIIENPFEMYKYLRKEKDFVKWTKFISERIIQLYLIPISLSSEDFNHIGKLIYLLFNINEQNTKDDTYINFINFCNLHNKLILESNRINMKIREFFPTLKCNINLGFLAKHLTWDKETITFEENQVEKSPDVLALEMKLQMATKKYYKYKAKYLESKDIGVDSIIKYDSGYQINPNKLVGNGSETSSVNPLLNYGMGRKY